VVFCFIPCGCFLVWFETGSVFRGWVWCLVLYYFGWVFVFLLFGSLFGVCFSWGFFGLTVGGGGGGFFFWAFLCAGL